MQFPVATHHVISSATPSLSTEIRGRLWLHSLKFMIEKVDYLLSQLAIKVLGHGPLLLIPNSTNSKLEFPTVVLLS